VRIAAAAADGARRSARTNEIALGGPGTPYIFDVVLSAAAI